MYKLYVGETRRKFESRFADHKRGEGNRSTNSLYARHFMEERHKFINPIENHGIIKIESKTNVRKLKEELEILKERKKGLNNLMNIKVNFENEEIFYHIIKKVGTADSK